MKIFCKYVKSQIETIQINVRAIKNDKTEFAEKSFEHLVQ